MKKLIAIALFSSLYSFGQNSIDLKSDLEKLLKSKNSNRNSWSTCDDDNSFFNKDTIYFQTKLEMYKCSKAVSWDFNSKNSFVQNSRQWVDGTHATIKSRITHDYDNYKLAVKNKIGKTILTLYRKGQEAESFEVIDFNSTQENKVITLLRIKTSP